MSKHSKWAKVKHQKGAVDVRRAAVFTKLARVITVAVREGGIDPNFNFKLRTAVDLALAGNMPKDNIDRAIKRGAGGEETGRIEEITYEGYGPGGAAILVVALTDNRNRTGANVRHIFSANGGNMGSAGSVQWMFDRVGLIRAPLVDQLSADVELALIDVGATNIEQEDGELVVITAPEALAAGRQAVLDAGLQPSYVAFEWQAKEEVAPPVGAARQQLEDLLEALDDNEDASEVFCNVALG